MHNGSEDAFWRKKVPLMVALLPNHGKGSKFAKTTQFSDLYGNFLLNEKHEITVERSQMKNMSNGKRFTKNYNGVHTETRVQGIEWNGMALTFPVWDAP